MEVQTIDAEHVNQFILRLKRGKAPWLDGIYREHLIFGNSEVLCASLASLYRVTWDMTAPLRENGIFDMMG